MDRALRLYIKEPSSNGQRIAVEICRLVMKRQTKQIKSNQSSILPAESFIY